MIDQKAQKPNVNGGGANVIIHDVKNHDTI